MQKLEECFDNLAQEAEELYLTKHVSVLDHVPTALEFYRDFVSANKPVVINGLIDHWSALKKWTPEYLRSVIGQKLVSVAVTPNGYADAVNNDRFVLPDERLMKMCDFLDVMDRISAEEGVFYIQKQNSNFTEEFPELLQDADSHIDFATEAFGRHPDAANFWMGDGRAVTSLHKDHYENLYCVVHGCKTFTLLPPTDQPFIPYKKFQAARYVLNGKGGFDVQDEEDIGMVPWIPLDPLQPDLKTYPEYRKTHPVQVTVKAGQTLYLPSLWFHHVQQSHGCIAVNFWYDMDYDIKYNYYKFVEQLIELKNNDTS